MDMFFIQRLGRVSGPFPKETLGSQWLLPGTLVKGSGDEHWKTLSETAELRDLLPAAKKRQNILYLAGGLIISAIAASILIILNTTISSEIIEQNINCRTDAHIALPRAANRSADTTVNAPVPEIFANEEKLRPLPVNTLKVSLTPPRRMVFHGLDAFKADIRNHFNVHMKINHSSFTADENGVHDVNVVVSNSTIFLLDEMIVNVQYMDAKGKIIDILPVSFRNIKPLCMVNQQAPPNSGARSVSFILVSALSKSLSFCFPSPFNVSRSKDPFYCK